jgi:hypothetical protein
MSGRKRFSVFLLAVVMLGSAALAEDIWIKAETVQIRSGKGAVFPVVATVTKGTKLTVVDREGHWILVQVSDQVQGYVYDGSTSTEAVGNGGNLLSDLGAGGQAADMSSGAAGKGLAPEAETWASGANLNPGPMNKLIDFRKHIDPKLWSAFTAEGKVGPDAPGAQ